MVVSFSSIKAGIDEAADLVSAGSDDLFGCSQELARAGSSSRATSGKCYQYNGEGK